MVNKTLHSIIARALLCWMSFLLTFTYAECRHAECRSALARASKILSHKSNNIHPDFINIFFLTFSYKRFYKCFMNTNSVKKLCYNKVYKKKTFLRFFVSTQPRAVLTALHFLHNLPMSTKYLSLAC